MRVGLLGDIHANIHALDVVLDALSSERVDEIFHLGDVVGYCADFREVIERLRASGIRGVIGNHELMLLDELDSARASTAARRAIDWSKTRLQDADREFIASLPRSLQSEDMVLFHAMPHSITRNVKRVEDAAEAFEGLADVHGWRVAIHGHTHIQRIFERDPNGIRLVLEGEGQWHFREGATYLACPGSVGVSRDGDARAAFMIYDSDSGLVMKRIVYPWRKCRASLRRAGLSTPLFVSRTRMARRRVRSILGSVKRSVVKKLRGSG